MRTLPILCILVIQAVYAQNKARYDLDPQAVSKQAAAASYDYRSAGNALLEYTLITQGYFTLGTTGGVDPGSLDDGCQITFGHPYAKTSSPVFSLDGTWYRPDDYFAGGESAISASADSLVLVMSRLGKVRLRLCIAAAEGSRSAGLRVELANLDDHPHSCGIGMLIDPALGKWGDGELRFPWGFLREDSAFGAPAIPNSIQVYEYSRTPMGMGIAIESPDEPPDRLTAENWLQAMTNPGPDFSPSGLGALYDLVLKYFWHERILAPNESISCSLRVTLLQPDFGDAIFLRSDLPQALTIENGLLYPRSIRSVVTAYNALSAPRSGLKLTVSSSDEIRQTAPLSSFSVEGHGTSYINTVFESKESYDDRALPVTISCTAGGATLATMTRRVFMPAVPVSDTGLVVSIDTVRLGSPRVELRFHAQRAATGALITALTDENIRLEENGARRRQFTLGKDPSGGVNAVDIVFALDVTGSMTNIINAVKSNIREFADSLHAKGIDYRLGMVTFLDDIENEYPFTGDIGEFQKYVDAQYAHNGGDAPENSLEALLRASRYPWRASGVRIIIWITDSNYHELDAVTPLSRKDLVQALLAAGTRLHSIGSPSYHVCCYDPIVSPTGGNFYDINGKFRDILLDIGRFGSNSEYLLSYDSPLASGDKREITLTLHFAGLGGNATWRTGSPPGLRERSILSCYPNPFNPATRIRVHNPSLLAGSVEIYTMLGRKVKSFSIAPGGGDADLLWDARSDDGSPVATGCYLVRTRLIGREGAPGSDETMRLIHLK